MTPNAITRHIFLADMHLPQHDGADILRALRSTPDEFMRLGGIVKGVLNGHAPFARGGA